VRSRRGADCSEDPVHVVLAHQDWCCVACGPCAPVLMRVRARAQVLSGELRIKPTKANKRHLDIRLTYNFDGQVARSLSVC
jgi:hypothetical protein